MTAHAAIKNTFFEDFFVQKSLTIILFLCQRKPEQRNFPTIAKIYKNPVI